MTILIKISINIDSLQGLGRYRLLMHKFNLQQSIFKILNYFQIDFNNVSYTTYQSFEDFDKVDLFKDYKRPNIRNSSEISNNRSKTNL